ncbi:MAG: glutamine amidotransferase-related protein, partial [Akkermansia sp.]
MSQPNVWIIDHRDSFTWNLAELAAATGMAVPRVVPHDSPGLEHAVRKGEKVILSPGPGVVHDSCHRATFRLLRRLPPD